MSGRECARSFPTHFTTEDGGPENGDGAAGAAPGDDVVADFLEGVFDDSDVDDLDADLPV